MEKEYEFTCNSCDEEFTIITTSREKPSSCCFCGSSLDTDKDDYGDDEDEFLDD